MAKLLIVEDEDAIASAIRRGLEYEGYDVIAAGDGLSALTAAAREAPDLIVLDVMLPGLDGLDVCARLRSAGDDVPIIMLTARDQEMDKVSGLRTGADDYLTKPFSFFELLARIEAVLRRRPGARAGAGAIALDRKRMEATKDGKKLGVSRREFRILQYFVDHRDEIVTRDQLLDAVWGYESFPFSRTVDIHIAKLRKKVEDDPANPRLIVTVHGVGYKYLG
jgi:two-component system alkaline phosphatase synthesis response regulator PhoP